MKRVFIIFPLLLISSLICIAHDVQVAVELSPPAVITRSSYSGSEPISYAAVLIYSPSDSGTEYQNGRSDAAGVFSFVPDRPGNWKFVIDDEMGHKKEKTIEITDEFLKGSGTAKSSGELPTYWKMLIGVSIIIGCTGILFWAKARKAQSSGKRK
jgi:nickel transport protein